MLRKIAEQFQFTLMVVLFDEVAFFGPKMVRIFCCLKTISSVHSIAVKTVSLREVTLGRTMSSIIETEETRQD